MIKRLLLVAVLGVAVSGCFMAPMALVGPVTSGFSTASIIQSGVGSTVNYLVKKSSGKTIAQHAFDAVNFETIKQTYFPDNKTHTLAPSKSGTVQVHKN